MNPTSVKLTADDIAFLKNHKMKLSDVVHYGLLQLRRVVPERGIPLCIYLDIQSRATHPQGHKISAPKGHPRTCQSICNGGCPDPAACGQKENEPAGPAAAALYDIEAVQHQSREHESVKIGD